MEVRKVPEKLKKKIVDCPMCGTKCTVEGRTTLHYEPVHPAPRRSLTVEELEMIIHKYNEANKRTIFITTGHATTRYPVQYKRDIKGLACAIVSEGTKQKEV